MKFIDTHSHMYSQAFDADRGFCMKAAMDAGVYLTALPNIDVESIAALRQLMNDFPDQTIGMMGLHPCSVTSEYKVHLKTVEAELRTGLYHAVGEIGVDLHWDKSTLADQIAAFEVQIGWAKDMSLPIVIHARESFQEIFAVLDRMEVREMRGIFHCFTGNVDEAKKALSYPGFLLGVGGVLTFKNGGLDKVLPEVGIERLVLETDAPYLAPKPFRGKRNETAYTRLVAEKLAEVLDMALDEVAEITTKNALEIFQIDGY